MSERVIASYYFEAGEYVRIVASSDVTTADALEKAELIVSMKRLELAHGKDAARRFKEWMEGKPATP